MFLSSAVGNLSLPTSALSAGSPEKSCSCPPTKIKVPSSVIKINLFFLGYSIQSAKRTFIGRHASPAAFEGRQVPEYNGSQVRLTRQTPPCAQRTAAGQPEAIRKRAMYTNPHQSLFFSAPTDVGQAAYNKNNDKTRAKNLYPGRRLHHISNLSAEQAYCST